MDSKYHPSLQFSDSLDASITVLRHARYDIHRYIQLIKQAAKTLARHPESGFEHDRLQEALMHYQLGQRLLIQALESVKPKVRH